MQPLVSVIIPVYNAEKHIEQTLLSVLTQSYAMLEVIIVNDGSGDRSLEIINRFDDRRIVLINQPNKGASAAKQAGLEIATGAFIQYLDADDLLSANKIEIQVNALIKHPEKIALCDTVHFFDGTDHTTYPIPLEWYAREINDDPVDFLIKLYGGDLVGPQYGGMIQPNAFLVPTPVAKLAGPWDVSISPCPDEDGEYFCRILLASKGIEYTNGAVNYYRKFKNRSSLSAVRNYKACANTLQSTLLKTKHLLSATTENTAKLAMGRQLMADAISFYPEFMSLYREAVAASKKIAPMLSIRPYLCIQFLLMQVISGKNTHHPHPGREK